MDVSGYTIDRVDPTALPPAEQEAIARLFQRMWAEAIPEDPERALAAILPRLRTARPNSWSAHVRVRDGSGAVVGWGAVNRSLNEPENAHLAWTELMVHPDHRRRGLGRAILGELVRAAEGQHPDLLLMGMESDRVPAGGAFLRAAGGQPGLPMKTNQLDLAAVDRAQVAEWAALPTPGYTLERIDGSVPERLLGAYLEAANGMNDAPKGDLRMADWKLTAEQVRDREGWFRSVGVEWWLILAVHDATGAGAGFTEVTYDPKQPTLVWQQGTATVPAHRGHRLGLKLKAVNLARILAERPAARYIRTGNANVNAQMLEINTKLGFRQAWQSTIWQLPAADAAAAARTAGATEAART
jgi:GNAT superfamily N-acetyltransferase